MSEIENHIEKNSESVNSERRSFLIKLIPAFMLAGLAASYGGFLSFAGRFLYPSKGRQMAWLFVTETKKLKMGRSITYVGPTGEKVAVARQSSKGTIDDFVALSSTCPHLGCQVHWQGSKERFFCPCHNGAFNAQGEATEGPPLEARQQLPSYPLKVENDLLFIQVPVNKLATRTI